MRRVALSSLLGLVACRTPESPASSPSPVPALASEAAAPLSEPEREPDEVVEDELDEGDEGLEYAGPELHMLAHREGPMVLIHSRDQPYLLLEGEPVPIDPQRGPVRDPALGAGLDLASWFGRYAAEPRFGLGGVLAGQLDDQAWLAFHVYRDRVGRVPVVYVREDGRWSPLGAADSPLIEYFVALVSWSDEVVALRLYEPRSDVYYAPPDEPDDPAERERERAALRKVKPGFVRLRGSGAFVTPKLSKHEYGDIIPLSAIATPEGTIHSLVQLYVEVLEDGAELATSEPGGEGLLVWAPGKAEPKLVELPGYGEDHLGLSLSLSGEHVLAWANASAGAPYLAFGRGTTWEPIAIELLDVDDPVLHSVARSPDGELWLVVYDDDEDHEPCTLWHKPTAGAWTRVRLPRLELPRSHEDPRWLLDWERREWLQVEPIRPRGRPNPTEVIWAAGAIWVSAELDDAFESSVGLSYDISHTALYSTRAIGGQPVELPPIDRVLLERELQSQVWPSPGQRGCQTFVLSIGDEQRRLSEAELAALRDARRAVEGGTLGLIYLAERGSTRELVVFGGAKDPAGVERVRAQVERVVGTPVSVDCRIPAMARPVADLGEAQ